MRSGKRALAGVAAGALGLALVPLVGISSATAATTAGSVSPVRPGTAGTIPAATIAFTGSSVASLSDDDTLVAYLTTAPGAGTMWFDDSAAVIASTDDSISLARNNRTVLASGGAGGTGFFGVNSDDDSTIAIAIDTAGSYIGGVGNGEDTVTFSITTVGAPASMTLTPASQTVTVGQTAALEVKLLDANGNLTQPLNVDAIGLSDNSDDTIVGSSASTTAITSLTASSISDGSAAVYLRTYGNAAGTTTVTATPQGTLVSAGLTAQTATVTKSGAVSVKPVKAIAVTTPSNAIEISDTVTAATAQVPSPTTTVVVTFDDTTVNPAGTSLRWAARVLTGTGGTVNGKTSDDTAYIDVTTDANKKGTITLALGGGAAVDGGSVEVFQVDVLNTAVPSGGKETVYVKTPAVQTGDVVMNPAGNIVAKVGDTTPVTVQVDDSFGTPQAGWPVVIKESATAKTVASGATGADGSVALTITPLATVKNLDSITYTAYATNPLTAASTAAAIPLIVNYTTSGAITTLSVVGDNNGTAIGSACSNSSCTLTNIPQIKVPATGVMDDSTASQWSITNDDSVSGTPAPGNYAVLKIGTSPSNAAVVTVPEGVKVASKNPETAEYIWSDGAQTAVIGSSSGTGYAYIWATKTGTHEVTVESGGLTLTYKVHVVNNPVDAYNISLTPAKQDLTAGGIGTVTLAVTDVFGNGVKTSTSNGYVKVSASGEVLLAGYAASNEFTTDAAGLATITVIAGNSAGAGLITAVPATGDGARAWQASYTPPTGAPAPVASATSEVTVTTKPTTKTIVITGERGTVKGKPGIMVDGITTGFAEGDLVAPWIKFPGQTSYSEGSARPAIDAQGEFYWQRKTGKKIYVYFTNENGDVKSDRIIIAAK